MVKTSVERERNTLLWMGMVGPAVIWLIYLECSYLLVHFACKSGNQTPLHVSSLIFLLLSIAVGFLTWRERPGSSEPAGDTYDPTVNRIRLMVAVGIMSSIEFTLLIAGSWLAMFFLNPCQS